MSRAVTRRRDVVEGFRTSLQQPRQQEFWPNKHDIQIPPPTYDGCTGKIFFEDMTSA